MVLLRHASKGIHGQSKSTCCCYCGVGCGVVIDPNGRTHHPASGDPDHPANCGRLYQGLDPASPAISKPSPPALHPELRASHQRPPPRELGRPLDTAAGE